MSEHTPGPWAIYEGNDEAVSHWRKNASVWSESAGHIVAYTDFLTKEIALGNARLIAAAPDMLAALHHVRKIIVEAAETGFNCHDGDWAERLFASQSITFDAVRKAEGRS